MYALKTIEGADDAILIASVLEGDEDAFRTLVLRYEERVFRVLARFTRDRMETEDLAQEVFLKVFRKLDTFQQDSAFYTWVYRIAVNTATDQLSRRKRRRLHLVSDDSMLDHGPSGETGASAEAPLLEEEMRQVTRQVRRPS